MNFWKRQAASRNLSGEHLCTINTSHSNDKLEIVFLETKRISISNPYDFEHQSHIGRDRDTSFGVEKLPPQWRTLLENERLRKLNSCSPKHLSFSSHSSTSTFSSVESDSSDTETTTDQEAVNLNGLCDYSDPKLVYKGWKKLAQGSTAIIYSTVNKINPSIRIAMKVLHCPQYKQTQQLVSEIKVLQFCKHKNIVSLIACHYYQNRLFLGMEFMDKGSVTDLIEKHQGILAENAISRILEQVLQGLVYIHQNDIIHRDLKSDNILINSNGDIKIADFGYCSDLRGKSAKISNSVVGTPCWMSPELIQGLDYNTSVDIWSIGIFLMEMAEGEPPLLNLPPLKALFIISSGHQPMLLEPEKWSSDLLDFLSACVRKDAEARPTASELLIHSFLSSSMSDDEWLKLIE